MWRVMSSLSLPDVAGFLRVLRFPPVVTLDPKEVALTGPLGRTALVAVGLSSINKSTLPLPLDDLPLANIAKISSVDMIDFFVSLQTYNQQRKKQI